MKSIVVEGKEYPVIENLGYSHDAGCFAKVVETESGERVAVRQGGSKLWKFWKAQIRPSGRPVGMTIPASPAGAGERRGT